MDIELLQSNFKSIQRDGVSEVGLLYGYVDDEDSGDDPRELTITWLNLKVDEVRGIYGFSAPYAGSVVTSDLPFRSAFSPYIKNMRLEARGEKFDILSIVPLGGVAIRLDLAKAVKSVTVRKS